MKDFTLEPTREMARKLKEHDDELVDLRLFPPMSTSSRGSARERQYAKLREAQGWSVRRLAGSKGAEDLVLMRKGLGDLKHTQVTLSQVKTDKLTPWQHFGPVDRRRLREEAEKIGADAELVWWPAHGEMRVLRPSEWPD